MSYPLDDMDWLQRFEATCRKCGTCRTYGVRELLRLRLKDLHFHDLRRVLRCPRNCGGTEQKVTFPGGSMPPEPPIGLRVNYALVRLRRSGMTPIRAEFQPCDYQALAADRGLTWSFRLKRDGEPDNDARPITDLAGIRLIVSTRTGGSNISCQDPKIPLGSISIGI